MKRRAFLGASLGLAASGLSACSAKQKTFALPPGTLSGTNFTRAHRLQQTAAPPEMSETLRIPVLIIGAGISGLSAAWKFQSAGFKDFLISELEEQIGGNSRYGENPISRFPLGAHYLPLPSREARAERALLADLGVLQGDPKAERPTYDERYLCATPQERLFQRGSWHESLMPSTSQADEPKKIQRFHELIDQLRQQRDRQGRRIFSIPMEYSSRDPKWLALDRITLSQWLKNEDLDCPALRWYLNYTSRDDFGTGVDQVSAWAGLHYFACRNGEAENASSDTVLTAPEGNAWIVRRLEERLRSHLRTGWLATAIREVRHTGKTAIEVDFFLANENRSLRIISEQVIWAAPLFVLPHVWHTAPPELQQVRRDFSYAPWLVANLTLKEAPHTRSGAALAWDNVLHEGQGLGYIVATHQQLRVRPGPTVITYYQTFDHPQSLNSRQKMLAYSRETWADAIFQDLKKAHPELPEITQQLDVFLHGHAMIKPMPGLIWGQTRQALTRFAAAHPANASSAKQIHLAHTDLSGMSLFEEANYRGVLAAEQILDHFSIHHQRLS